MNIPPDKNFYLNRMTDESIIHEMFNNLPDTPVKKTLSVMLNSYLESGSETDYSIFKERLAGYLATLNRGGNS